MYINVETPISHIVISERTSRLPACITTNNINVIIRLKAPRILFVCESLALTVAWVVQAFVICRVSWCWHVVVYQQQ